jgi:hypothetical protein
MAPRGSVDKNEAKRLHEQERRKKNSENLAAMERILIEAGWKGGGVKPLNKLNSLHSGLSYNELDVQDAFIDLCE